MLQGHFKYLLTKIFSDKNSKVDFFKQLKIKQFEILNQNLKEIQFPHIFNRKQSKLNQIAKWKSSDIKICQMNCTI